MIALLFSLWLWEFCGPDPIAYFKVEMVYRYPVATIIGRDELGNGIPMPLYNPWQRVLIQQNLDTSALVPCDPLPGELCVVYVTSYDDAGNPDDGVDCPWL